MEDANGTPSHSRENTSGAASQTSGESRGTSPANPAKVEAGTPLNFDHPHYVGHSRNDHDRHAESISEEESMKETPDDIIPEVRDGIADQRDVEASPGLEKQKTARSARSARDPNLVSWDGPDDPANPKNWSMKRKWAATLVVSSFTFISPVSSSMVAPALTAIAAQFNITNEIELSLTLSIFVLAYAIGPLFLGPMSEIYGRVIVLQTANLFYLFFNLACGLAQNKGQLIAFRFLSGLGGSAPLAIGGGVLSDLFTAEQRGRAISIYSLAPLLGPAVGPVAGGFISENTTWRWGILCNHNSRRIHPIRRPLFSPRNLYSCPLAPQKEQAHQRTGNEALYTEFDHPDRTLGTTIKISLIRPFKLLGTQVIVQVLAVYMAYLYGMMYLVLSTFPALWEDEYHESVGIGGLNYISLGVGFFIGTQVCAPSQDKIYAALKRRNNGVGKPEFRVPLMIPGAVLIPIGLFCYGWTAQAHTHWILPNIGAAIFAAGSIVGFQCIQGYIVDSYTRYAASAVGAATVLRSLAGFGFPLFAPYLYDKLHYGWGQQFVGFYWHCVGVAGSDFALEVWGRS